MELIVFSYSHYCKILNTLERYLRASTQFLWFDRKFHFFSLVNDYKNENRALIFFTYSYGRGSLEITHGAHLFELTNRIMWLSVG